MADNTVWVPVLASMKGFIASVNKGAGQAAKSAGSTLEKGLGDAGDRGGQSAATQLAAQVESATTKVVAARQKEINASGALATAEQQLANMRSRGDASASQIMAAEAKVSQARDTQQVMAQRAASAEEDLDNVRDGEPARATAVVAAENHVEDARLKAMAAADKARVASVALDEAKQKSASAADRVVTAEQQLADVRERGDATAKEIRAAEREVESARKAADKASVSAVSAEGKLKSARSGAESATDQLKAADLRHKAALDDVARASQQAESATDDLSGSMDELSDGMGGIRDLVGKGGGLLAGMGIAVGTSEILGSVDAIAQMNNQLGITGDTADIMGDQVGSVMRSGLAGSAEEAAEAVGALHSQFGYLGSEGERTADDLSRNFLAFTSTFGTDMNEAVMMAGNLVTNGLAGDVTEAADLMTTAMQRVPAAMRDELPEIMGEYGTNFRALGFTGEEAFGVLVSAADKGKWALDKTGDSLKEFTIRGTDMSKASVDAYEAAGLSAEDMAAKLLQGGDAAQGAFKQTVDGLLGIPDPVDRANQALALFGTPLEDLSPDKIDEFLQSLSDGTNTMEGFSGASDELADSVSGTLSARLDALKGTITDVAAKGFMFLWDAISPIADWAKNNASWLTPIAVGVGVFAGAVALAATAAGLWAGAQMLLNTALLGSPITWIVAAVAGLAAALVWVFTKTEWGQQVWDGFVNILKGAWDWISTTFMTGWHAIGDVLSTVWDGVKAGWDILWQAIQTAWTSILQPLFSLLWQVVSTTLGVIATVILTPLMLAWNLLSTAIQWAWTNLIQPTWNAISTVAQWLWNSVLMPVFGWIKQGWAILATGIQTVWSSVIKPAWDAVSAAAQWLWNSVLSPVFGWIQDKWRDMSTGIQVIWESVIKPAWDAVGDALQWLWDNIVSPVLGWIQDKWRDMSTGIQVIWESVIKPAFDALKDGLQSVGDFFDTIVDGIKTVWESLHDILAKPIRFLVDTVYNQGIKPAWNAVAGFLPIDPAPDVAGFATGGAISGPGTGTSDDIVARLSNGEHVLTAADVDALGGQGSVYQMRGLINQGKTFTVTPDGVFESGTSRKDNGPLHPVAAFADGGEVKRPAWEAALERGHQWAQSVSGRPYLTGSQWDAGGDCSGYMSAIASVILGAEPNAGHWATPVFPAGQGDNVPAGNQVWAAGLSQGMSIGMTGGPQSGGAMGHTAGTLSAAGSFGSVNVESGGSHGNVAYGGPAAGADDGQWTSGNYHLPIGADGDFESAGGPSPEEKRNWLRDKVKDLFDQILSPIDSVIDATVGTPPPELFGIPRGTMEEQRDNSIDWFFEKINQLGDLLGSAYNKAKDLGGAILDGAKSAGGWAWDHTLGKFFADGGITGGREDHRAQIARGGDLRIWAEKETAGEAYIPLASSKRSRSTEILGQVANRFGYDLVDKTGTGYEVKGTDVTGSTGTFYADGGIRTASEMISFATGEEVDGKKASRSLDGAPYVWGGEDWGDCSSAMGELAAFMIGEDDVTTRKFSTADEGAWLTSHGFTLGRGADGTLRIGWNSGHTSGQLPDGTLVEMSNPDDGGFVGSGAQSLDSAGYTDFAWISAKEDTPEIDPAAVDTIPDTTPPADTIPDTATATPDTATAAAPGTSSTGGSETTISGMVGDVAKEAVSGQVSDALGVFGISDQLPSWVTAGRDAATQLTSQDDATGETVDPSATGATAMQDAATSTTPDTTGTTAADATTAAADATTVEAEVDVNPVPDWGPEFFVHEIARQAKDMGLSADAAKIGVATALVESGDPLQMLANEAVPESLGYRHDGIGSDGDSVGLFQQRDFPVWGTVADRMDPHRSAGSFFKVMLEKFPDWETMDPGAVAQGTQVSAYPDRYAGQMSKAEGLVADTNLFDQGGVLDHDKLALNLSGKPEAVLTNEEWQALGDIADAAGDSGMADGLSDLATAGISSATDGLSLLAEDGISTAGGVASGALQAGGGALAAAANTVLPGSGAIISGAASAAAPLVDVGADLLGSFTANAVDGVGQTLGQAVEEIPGFLDDAFSVDAPAGVVDADATPSGPSGVDTSSSSTTTSDGGGGDGQGGPTVIYQVIVQDKSDAYETIKRFQNREYAGFGVTRV